MTRLIRHLAVDRSPALRTVVVHAHTGHIEPSMEGFMEEPQFKTCGRPLSTEDGLAARHSSPFPSASRLASGTASNKFHISSFD